MQCSLDREINKCPFLENDLCKNENTCSFQVQEDKVPTQKYVREKRWYEVYYEKKKK